jgi:tetratricopeptide (TPR) repeat protein
MKYITGLFLFYIFCSILFLTSANALYAQTQKVDSLKAILSKTETDSTRFNLSIKILDLQKDNRPDRSLIYADSLLQIKKIKEFPEQYSRVLILKMKILNRLSEFEKALKLKPSIEGALNGHNIRNQELRYLNELGVSYQNLSKYSKAIEAYYKVFEIAYELENIKVQILALNNLSTIHLKLNEFDKAEEYLQKGLTIARSKKLTQSIGIILANLGNLENDRKNFTNARIYFKEALEIFEQIELKYGEGLILNNLGYLEFQVREYNLALDYFNKSEEIRKSIGDRAGLIYIYFNKGNVYKELANWEEALENYNLSIKLSEEIRSSNRLEEVYKSMVEIYERTNDYSSALIIHKKLLFLKDSLFQVDLSNALDKKKTSIDALLHEQELSDLKQQNRSFQKKSYIIIFALLVLIIISTFLWIKSKKEYRIVSQPTPIIKPEVNLDESLTKLKEKLQKGGLDAEFWMEFGIIFDSIHPGFSKAISQKFSNLTSNELRICCLIKLGLNNYDLADCLNITTSSVRKARYRIYKKMEMATDKEMVNYLLSI